MFAFTFRAARRSSRRVGWMALGSALAGLSCQAQTVGTPVVTPAPMPVPVPMPVLTPVLTLDQALRAAQDRSRQLVAQDAAAAASREMCGGGATPGSDAQGRHQQPAGQRSGSVQRDTGLHDNAQDRCHAGLPAQGEAPTAR